MEKSNITRSEWESKDNDDKNQLISWSTQIKSQLLDCSVDLKPARQ